MKRTCATCGTDYTGRACPTCVKRTQGSDAPVTRPDALPYKRCAWEANGLRCKYPGTITTSLRPDDSTEWFCHYHANETDGARAQIALDASQDYQHPTTEELLQEANREALDRLEARGLGQRFGESNRDYLARLMEECRARTRALVKQVKGGAI